MIKKIIISIGLLTSFASFAQQGTSSPYSFYGIGDSRFEGTLENRSMGGVSVEQDSIHLNIENPSSYANLKQTVFTVGGSLATTRLKTDVESANTQRVTFDYLAVGLPMGKLGVAFGLVPLSSVGYKILDDNSSTPNATSSRFEGNGGLSKVFLGAGYKIKPNWDIGADVQYNFGKIETTSIEAITGVQSATREITSSDLLGVNFNLGTMYQAKVDKKLNLYTSLNYTFASSIRSTSTRTTEVDGDSTQIISDPSEDDLKIPGKVAIGVGVGESQKWLVGTTVAFQGAGDFQSYYNASDDVYYEKYAKYAIGGYYIPNYTSFSGYFKRITYRAGLKYEKIGLVVNNESIRDIGMTLGAALPISGTFSNVNLGIEFGKKGTTSSGLVQENYVNFSMSFSFNDKWFVRSKYN